MARKEDDNQKTTCSNFCCPANVPVVSSIDLGRLGWILLRELHCQGKVSTLPVSVWLPRNMAIPFHQIYTPATSHFLDFRPFAKRPRNWRNLSCTKEKILLILSDGDQRSPISCSLRACKETKWLVFSPSFALFRKASSCYSRHL